MFQRSQFQLRILPCSIFMLQSGSEIIVGRFLKILDTCEFARFAPGGGSEGMQELYNEATEVMSEMEKEIK